jgi:hypothetical protein
VTAQVESSEVVFLFTSVGRRVELLRHFISAAKRHEGPARIIGTEIDPLAPAAQLLGATSISFRGPMIRRMA